MADLLQTLGARDLLQDATPGLATRLARGSITGYCGFDPTADSLHVGNLIPVMGLAWLQRTGGRPLVVIGGGTGLVGDPSGRRSERPLLDRQRIDENAAALQRQLERFLDFEGPRGARLLNNADWLRPLRLLDFLRDTGKHFTLGYMLQKESVKSRLDSGLSFTEFSYMLVQAYDFAHLYRTEGCELQLGGSDQWGNITAGIELVSRAHQAEVHGLTLPLLVAASGAKLGKSEAGNVWLDPARTSVYQFYQYWITQDDRDVARLLRSLSFLELEEVASLMRDHELDPGRRSAQRRLATELTTRVHGADAARRAEAASAILFGGSDIREAEPATLEALVEEVPIGRAARTELDGGRLTLVDALLRSGLSASKAEARRGLPSGGFALNGQRVTADRPLTAEDLLQGRYLVLQKGRRNYAMVVVR